MIILFMFPFVTFLGEKKNNKARLPHHSEVHYLNKGDKMVQVMRKESL